MGAGYNQSTVQSADVGMDHEGVVQVPLDHRDGGTSGGMDWGVNLGIGDDVVARVQDRYSIGTTCGAVIVRSLAFGGQDTSHLVCACALRRVDDR